MKKGYKIYHRIIAMVLVFTILFPIMPFRYIDMRFGTSLEDYNAFATKASAVEYDSNNVVVPFNHGYTGEVFDNITITNSSTGLATVQEWLATASANPDNLYVITYDAGNSMPISGTVNLVTDGHVKIVRGPNNTGHMFSVNNASATLNIGSENMSGTIEISGGATFTLDSSMTYNFASERTTTRNYKTVNGEKYVLFNDGEDYSIAHWYKVGGINSSTSGLGLIRVEKGTLNLYGNARVGDVFQAASANGKMGALNIIGSGIFNMYGGEISWNAMGVSNNGAGSALYVGNSGAKDKNELQSNAIANINNGLIQYNTALDIETFSADGGAVAVDGATLNIRGGKISNSRAGSTAIIGSAANAGGISGRCGAVISMYGGEISNNYTGCVGGGVCLWYSKFHMYGGTITRNYARYGGGAGMSTSNVSIGSEIYLYNNATISENYAEYGGGVSAGALGGRGKNAKFVMLNGNVINNTAIEQGGGICNYNDSKSSLDLRGGTISNNKAGNGGAGISINNLGTADPTSYLLELSGGISINTNNDVLISELKKYNSSDETYQTPIWVKGRLNSTGTIALVSMNNYTTYAGTDIVKFKREDGGTLEVQNNKFAIDTNQYVLNEIYNISTLRLEALTVSSDTYVARNGNTIYTDLKDAIDAANNGDTIYVINNITLVETIDIDKDISIVSETTKTKNDSNVVDSNLKNESGTSVSGFTYQPVGDYTISLASNFVDNNSNTSAFVIKNGAVFRLGNSEYTEEDITISLGGFLTLDGNGGHGINGSLIEIQNGGELEANAGVTIANNTTNNGLTGAGVNVSSGGQLTLNGANIKYNKTTTNGAGVYVAGNMTMNNGHVDENESHNGAGIYVANGGNISIANGSIKDNTASNDGAGIYIAGGGKVTFNDGSISDNEATNDGAGIYIASNGTYVMKSGNISNNRTINGNGAGIYLDGNANISGGSFNGNIISSYNSSPKGRGILVNTGSELHISKDIYLDSSNPVYITSGELLYVDASLNMSHAIPINSEVTESETRIAKINTEDVDKAREIEEKTLSNKSIYEIKYNKEIIGETADDGYYLIYDAITIVYNGNNAKSGDGILPVDNTQYSGGDDVDIKPQNSTNPITRDGYVFIGWSPVQVSPITSAANELNVKIYYPTALVDGVIYNYNYKIFENTTFYAVWAVDANHNTIPDYRENVLNISIAPSVNGAMSSSLEQAQGGMFVLLTAAPADGYEVDTIEIKYTLNGIEGTYSLENNKVIKLDEKLFYFNMPLADATIYTTFKVQTINEVKITWNDGTEEEWGTLQSAINEIKSNTSKQGKKITLLKYVYSKIDTIIPEGINIEFDLNGHTLDMNHLPFVINEGASLKISDSMTGGKLSFDSTGGLNNVANNLVNNGTLNITGGLISMDEGSDSTHNLIQNNGTLTMSAGSVKHNDENGIAIYNNGTATLTGGNINGGKYAISQVNTAANSLDISGFGPITTYGVNLDNYLSSIYLAKNTFVNVSGVINNCAEDNSVSTDNLIHLYLDDTIGLNEPIIKSNRVETMVKHFRMHFDLANRTNNVIAVNTTNEAVLIEKPGKIFTEAGEDEYQYRTNMVLNAKLYKSDNTTPYVGATGKVYFFLLDTVAQWHDVWRPDLNQLVFREGWGLEKAIGSAQIDSETGIASCTISTDGLDLKSYYIFAMYYGDGTYDTYSVDGPVSSGYVGPIVAKNEQQGIVEIIQKNIDDDSVVVNSTESKIYNGQEQKSNIEIQIYDGEALLTEDVDYEVHLPATIVNAGDYTINIVGIGKYDHARNDVTFTVQKYNGQINIEGVLLKYAAGNVPNISFEGSGTAKVTDIYSNSLQYGTDYDIKYYKMNSATEEYEEISELQSNAGVYKIVATCKSGSTNYKDGLTAETAFVISSDGSSYEATVENNSLTYNGRERTLAELGEITVSGRKSLNADEETLTRDTDYTVMFGSSTVKNAGTYSVIIQGKGEYAELVNLAVDITISKKELTKSNTTITFTDADLEYEYNGKTIVPLIQSIEIDGVDTSGETGTPLVAGVDYVTSVSGDNLKVCETNPKFLFTTLNGNYSVTTLDYPFHISPRSLTNNDDAVVSIYQSGFTGEEIIPVITVIDKLSGTSKKLTEDDYTVSYRVSDIPNNTAALSNGYPLNKGTYDVLVKGKGNYTGQKVESFVVGNYRGRIIATLDPNVYTYTGNESALHGSILNALTVTRGDTASGDELVYGTDFKLGYGTPENTVAPSEVGEYLLYIVGIGNYDEIQTTTTYQISPLTGTVHIELSNKSLIYNGKIQRPELDKAHSYLLVDGENVYLNSLVEGRDYSVIVDENSVDVGGYILQINGIGRYAGNYNFASYQIAPLSINDDSITIKSIKSTDKEYNGQPQTLSFTPSGDAWLEYKYDENEAPIILVENRDFTVVHSNNTNGGIAVAVIAGNGNYGNVRTYTFVIESKMINSGDNLASGYTLTGIEDKNYTGLACEQDIVLTDTVLNKTLVKGTDYVVSYTNNIEVGTANYKIEGKGNYKGAILGTFNIKPISIENNSDITVNVTNNNEIYSTDAKMPEITVSYRRNSTTIQLHENVDFVVEHGENAYTNVGTYTFTIKGKSGSNYTGSLQATYSIIPYTDSLNVSLSTDIYTNGVTEETIKNNLVVSYGNDTIDVDDLDVTFVPATLTAGNYTVKVEAKSSLPNYYASSSSKASGYTLFTIEGAEEIAISLTESSHVYTANTIIIPEENIIVNSGDSIAHLRSVNRDLTYMVDWNHTIKDVGTYTLTVKVLKGNNELQSATTTFEVTPKDISNNDVIVEAIEDQIYTGREIKPEFTIMYNEEDLTTNDYTAVYSNNKNVGEATITLVGKGNYVGTREIPFNVVRESEGDIIITLIEGNDEVTNSTYTYNDSPKTPEVFVDYVVSTGNRVELTKDSDYSVSYENNINAGTAKAIVTLKGNYSGSAEKTFKINKFNLANATIQVSDNAVYNGKMQKPLVEVKRGNVLLSQDEDFEVAYDGSFIDANTYSVILVRAMSGDTCNYNGEQSINYTINKYGLNEKETLLLDFSGGSASFKQGTIEDSNSFKNQLVVKDLNGNTLSAANYTAKYSSDGTNYSEAFPQSIGVYTVKVTGTGVNYAEKFDTAIRDFVIYSNTANVSESSATYKNANYSISEIINQITITSEDNSSEELPIDGFNVTFGNTTPKNIGTYTVIVSGKENTPYSGILATGEFKVIPADISFTSVSDIDYSGHSIVPEMTISGVANEDVVERKDYTITYSGDGYPASQYAPINAGTYQVIVKGFGNYKGTVTKTYNVKPISLTNSNVSVEVTNDEAIYNTEEQLPVISISYNTDNGTLRLTPADFEVIYDGTYKDANDYTVTVKAKAGSNFTGSRNTTFTIKPYTGTLNVTLSGDTSYTNGVTREEILSDLQVKYLNETIDSDDLDIAFTPETLTAGTFTLQVKAKDTLTNYYLSTDSRANGYVMFTIEMAGNISISVNGTPHVYTAHEIVISKDDVIVSGDKTVSELEDENIGLDYELNVNKTIKDVGTYTVTLKVSKDGNVLQTASTTYTVTQKDIADSDVVASSIADQIYTGSEIEPTFTLKYSGETLDDDDYTAVYSNNINAGVATIKIVGNGNYKGTKTITFNIKAEQGELSIRLYESGEEVTDTTYTFDGMPKTPEVKVYVGSTKLNLGSDYSLNYRNNVNSGTASVQVVLKDNYSGDKEAEFTINKFDLSNATLTLSDNKTYNGSVQKPSTKVTVGNTLLVENTDYEVSYDGSFKDVGTYDVTITAKDDSNYKGTNAEQFTIDKYGTNSYEELLLEFVNGKSSYKEEIAKNEFESNLQVKDLNGNVLTSGDYVITYLTSGDSYTNDYPQSIGSHTVKVIGTGSNYAGLNDVATREFTICVDSLDINSVEKAYKNSVYTIDDIVSDITIKSNLGTELPSGEFNISFGETEPNDAGKYTIIVSGKTESDYEGLIGTSEFTIKPVDTFTVDDIDNLSYTGSVANPSINVEGVNDEVLAEGKDYIVSYTGTDIDGNQYSGSIPPTKAGEYEALFTGIGNYDGSSSTKSFEIEEVLSGDIEVILSQEEFVYNEEYQVPVEIVKYVQIDYTVLLVSGTDYDVSYENASGDILEKANIIDVGNYNVVITLKGNYSGEIKESFKIVEAEVTSLNISIKENSKEYNKLPQDIELVVKDPKGNELTEGTDYKITYYKDSTFTTPTSTSDGATGEGKAPANSGKYYVKIEGLGDYDAVTSDTTFVITKKSIEDLAISTIDDQLYDGSAKKPSVTIKDGSDVVSSDEYELSYNNNTNVGQDTASVTIKMNDDSNYKGTKTVFFSIVVDEDEETTIELKDKDGNTVSGDTYTYDGTEKKPEVVVKRAGRTLEEGKDYKVSYSNNKNAGSATVKVTLKGDYSGSVSKEFTINPLDIKDATVVAKPEKSNYTGKDIRPEVQVTIETEDGKLLKLSSSDFEVLYPSASKNTGTYTVTVNAKSDNYKGSANGSYQIIKEKNSSGGGGGYVTVEKIVTVKEVVSGDTTTKPEIEDNSLLDKINHKKYITGYEDGTFKPSKNMTRAEVVTIFARLLKEKPKVNGNNTFTDVYLHWAKDDILMMSELGIVKGYEDGTFRPENGITRAEFATMISRFETIKDFEYESSFSDVPKDHWAYNTINYAKLMGWISGYEDGTFKPNNPITRAEAVTIINRMLGRVGDIEKINKNESYNGFTDINGHWAYYSILEATTIHEYEFDGKIEIWK